MEPDQVRHGVVAIRFSGDVQRARRYTRQARQLVEKLVRVMEDGTAESSGVHGILDDGVYAYARRSMDLLTVEVVADPEPVTDMAEATDDGKRPTPDIMSGIVWRGLVEKRQGEDGQEYQTLVSFQPTELTARLFGLPEADQEIARLAVIPDATLADDLAAPSTSTITHSQYTVLRPTMYSGTMVRLVQVLMGYGRVPKDGGIHGMVPVTSDEMRSRYLERALRNGWQIAYDWRMHRTDGLTMATDGRWWLVRISPEGVYARPLRTFAGTRTARFRQRAEEAGDTAALGVLDLFGGFPTGEPIATSSAERDAWKRAGEIVQIVSKDDMAGFYGHSWYSAWMGWAFSASGRDAHNTAWRWDDDGYQTGIHAAIRIGIGKYQERVPAAGGRADALRRHLQAARPSVDPRKWQEVAPAAMWKAGVIDDREQYLRMSPLSAFEAIDQLELPPAASVSGGIAIVGSGRLFTPNKHVCPVKFYDHAIGGLKSHIMLPLPGANLEAAPDSDTVVHVFFVGDVLNAVKVYARGRDAPTMSVEEDDGLLCDVMGTRTVTIRYGFSGAGNGIYSDALDERSHGWESSYRAVTNGVKTGVAAIMAIDDPTRPFLSEGIRTLRFRRSFEASTSSEGDRRRTAMAVPKGMREAYYYASVTYVPSQSTVRVTTYPKLTDAYTYTAWRNFPGWTGFLPMGCNAYASNWPRCWQLAEHPAGCGKVLRRTVMEQNVSESECRLMASDGPWASICADLDGMTMSTADPPTVSSSSSTSARAVMKVWLVGNFALSPIVASEVTVSGSDAPYLGDEWFAVSPGDDGVQQIFAQANGMGDGTTVRYCRTIDAPADELAGTPAIDRMTESGWTFIGVIDG